MDKWPREQGKTTLSSIWLVTPSLILWELWKERNRGIFRGEKETLRRCLNRIINAIEETVSVSSTYRQAMNIPYTNSDRTLQASWLGIRFKSPSGALVIKKKKREVLKVDVMPALLCFCFSSWDSVLLCFSVFSLRTLLVLDCAGTVFSMIVIVVRLCFLS